MIEKIIQALEDPKTLLEINKRNMKIFREEMIPNIYDEQKDFPKNKSNRNWQTFRTYSLPPSKWLLGVWSGQTYTALVQKSTKDRTVTVTTTATTNKLELAAKNGKYLNVVLYLSDSNKKLLQENAKKMILERINK